MPNFSIPLSGLKADNTALNTISNNLANMNTTAFKTQTTNFSDMFYASMGDSGSGNPIQVGSGAQVSSNSTDFTAGSFNTDGMSTSDMAVNGTGYFVVADSSGTQYLTRNGSFTEDTSGRLVTSGGQYLMGYEATNGTITSTTLTNLTLPTSGSVMSASQSTNFTLTANLDSADTTGTSFTSTANLYDSLGTEYTATVTYTKDATSNQWDYSVTMPESDFSATSTGTGSTTLATGTLSFDASGNLESVGGTAVTTTAAATVTFSVSGLTDGATIGDTANNLTWDLTSSTGKSYITQTAQASSNTSTVTDGYAAGTFQSFTVDTDGTINAAYSNSEKMVIGQVALASVANEQGLEAEGNSLYSTTTSSGTAAVGTPGSGVLGTVKDSALEGSNVDISTQFSDLIIAQRAFQADAKAITAFDTVTQSAINLIQS